MSVRVANGVNTLSAELSGRTVGQIRAMLSQALNIDPMAKTYVNGEEAGSEYGVDDGDRVEFIKAAGSKGLMD